MFQLHNNDDSRENEMLYGVKLIGEVLFNSKEGLTFYILYGLKT